MFGSYTALPSASAPNCSSHLHQLDSYSCHPACTEVCRTDRLPSVRPWAESVILSAAKDPGLIASAPVSEPCVSPFGSPNLDALDAASSLSPLSATLTKNTGGGGIGVHPERLGVFSSLSLPFDFKLSTVNLLSPIFFRIRTYKKPGGGGRPLLPYSLLTTHYSLLSRTILP
jgi:hypothetical protein